MLYVLRFAGGPEGKMPRTFCWTTPVDKDDYVRNKENMHWVHAVIQVKYVLSCVCGVLWNVFLLKNKNKISKETEKASVYGITVVYIQLRKNLR